MTRTRQIILIFALIGILMGVFAAFHNMQTGEVGWNTVFTIVQTIVGIILAVMVANDANPGTARQREPRGEHEARQN
ncbi:hypothetical protein [Corynebacterium cystitidis]|uniref:Uncharacterized protein n=1 Tax=Corynebacterium cystitidis DSM 20524 TaxID=1121357 RepID=A0A1H9WCV6_9CORY|nr:hypothetical protein [Corynebacterium cystitidis]WJY81830.1 hypothetical protein CCYS_04395 [Corynebacterium cystitidis DSM 20524]SES31675.1 hypothetical protein SAMN05661109_02666 [Corynebacterium cystitidis DSM 20524]SNV83126.1 Uncharacterised protein [Corynebacterium cystitidis]